MDTDRWRAYKMVRRGFVVVVDLDEMDALGHPSIAEDLFELLPRRYPVRASFEIEKLDSHERPPSSLVEYAEQG